MTFTHSEKDTGFRDVDLIVGPSQDQPGTAAVNINGAVAHLPPGEAMELVAELVRVFHDHPDACLDSLCPAADGLAYLALRADERATEAERVLTRTRWELNRSTRERELASLREELARANSDVFQGWPA